MTLNEFLDQITDLYSNDQPFTAEYNGENGGTVTPTNNDDEEDDQ